jgi:phospholipase D3/4
MYWALLPDPAGDDEKGFTDSQFEAMGAGAGRALYQALRDAAARGVAIRILQSPGFSGQKQESDTLHEELPDRVSIRSVDMGKWYGGSGIMHQKIWIFDSRHLYLGSANMDWKSISQVKEMGVAIEDCAELAADARKYFDTWWTFSAIEPTSVEVFDPLARIYRRVPPWSNLVPPSQRTESPLAGAGEPNEHVLGILHAGRAAQILKTHRNRFDKTSADDRGSDFTHGGLLLPSPRRAAHVAPGVRET